MRDACLGLKTGLSAFFEELYYAHSDFEHYIQFFIAPEMLVIET